MSEEPEGVRTMQESATDIDFLTATIVDLQDHLTRGTITSVDLCRAYSVRVRFTHYKPSYTIYALSSRLGSNRGEQPEGPRASSRNGDRAG